ncbi:MAG: chemotaxis protein CheR, partial [Akkermansiaceae bacterium]|nr:chemotaxis protein CheR [Akkermansiaceae bacterium]
AAGQLRGTDCREKSVRAGFMGLYSAAALEEVGRGRLERHFVKRGDLHEIRPELRAATLWEEEDLMRSQPAGSGYDLILCRNVAIYLDPGAVQSLWARLAGALSPGGYLVVGKAEKISLPGLRRTGPCIYVKTHAE